MMSGNADMGQLDQVYNHKYIHFSNNLKNKQVTVMGTMFASALFTGDLA